MSVFCLNRKCSEGPRIPAHSMLNYKYQLLVDGHGPAYDATIWKLLSRGVSFQIAPDELNVPLYSMWYSPSLHAYQHYIPTTMSHLGESVDWCLAHDKTCAGIAENARSTVQQILRLDVVLDYMRRVLNSLHEWQSA